MAIPTNTTTSSPIASTIPNTTNSLSTGIKAGIGVGATIGVLLTLSILILYLRKHRTKKSELSHPIGPKEPVHKIGRQDVKEIGDEDQRK
jgi:hypothetical protein